MDPVTILVVCAVVLTVVGMMSGIAVLILAINVHGATKRLEPTIDELRQAIAEYRELGNHLSEISGKVDHVATSFEGIGTKAAKASHVILSGIGGPVGKAAAVWTALRTGADVFFRVTGRNQHGPEDGEEEAVASDRASKGKGREP